MINWLIWIYITKFSVSKFGFLKWILINFVSFLHHAHKVVLVLFSFLLILFFFLFQLCLFFHEFFFLQCHNLFHRLYILFCGLLRFYILVSVLFLGNDFFLLLQLFEEIWWQWFLFCLFNLFFNMLWFYYFYCLFLFDLVFLNRYVFILFLSSLFVRWWFLFYYFFYLLWQSFYFINSLLLFFNFNFL